MPAYQCFFEYLLAIIFFFREVLHSLVPYSPDTQPSVLTSVWRFMPSRWLSQT